MNYKIVFLTFHNWESKRQGGFHKLAEYCCTQGNSVFFFSYPRPIYYLLRQSEYYNFHSVFSLMKGKEYKIGFGILINKTVVCFSLLFLRKFWKYMPSKLVNFFSKISLPLFSNFAKKNFSKADIFIFESTEAIFLFPTIKKMFPKSKIIYRPSDPLVASGDRRFIEGELKLLKESDIVFLVNEDAVKLYCKYSPDFKTTVNYQILPNGVDIKAYLQSYEKPKLFNRSKIALYVGARPIEWNVIIEAAELLREITFIIVCPVQAPIWFIKKTGSLENLYYINGIDKKEVPRYVTNADLIIVPNPQNMYKENVWGITAKYYQAMVANKPIVAYHDSKQLEDYGIKVTYTTEDFVNGIKKYIGLSSINYKYDIKDWEIICETFCNKINK